MDDAKRLEQGKRILEMRTRKGLTQEDLSKITNISVPYISRIEKGKVNITMNTLIKMSKAFDCSIEYLENGVASSPIKTEDNSTISSNKALIKRIRKSEPFMKDKDFSKYRKDIRDSLDDILYNSDSDMIKSLKTIVEKISDYSFTRNSMEQCDVESKEIYHDRCMKYVQDIYNELEYQIAHFLPEDKY